MYVLRDDGDDGGRLVTERAEWEPCASCAHVTCAAHREVVAAIADLERRIEVLRAEGEIWLPGP